MEGWDDSKRHRVALQTLGRCISVSASDYAVNVLATVSSFAVSNTSVDSLGFENAKEKVSNVLVWNVTGYFPCNVCGRQETDEIKGYGTCLWVEYWISWVDPSH